MSQRLKTLAVLTTLATALTAGSFAFAQTNATPPVSPQRNTTERDPNSAAMGTPSASAAMTTPQRAPMPNTSTTSPSPPLPLGNDGRSRDPMSNPRTDNSSGTTSTTPMTTQGNMPYDATRNNNSGMMNNNNSSSNSNSSMNDSTGTPMLPARRDRN